jgi:putative heme-binding domain-containing protein
MATDFHNCTLRRLWKALAVFCFMTALFGGCQSPALEADEKVHFAMQQTGDPVRGKEVFTDETRASCTKCHTTDGNGGKAGPDLAAIGDKFPRRELIRSILEPSASIAVGYGTTIIETKDGEEVQGIIKQATESWIELMDATGRPIRLATADIKDQRLSEISLMPAGWEQNLKPSEFADLIAYLESLHQAVGSLGRTRGMPEVIPQAARQVEFQPVFGTSIRLEHPVWFTEMPGITNRFVVLEGAGKVWLIQRSESDERQSLLLDLTPEVHFGGGSGLLGMAFHPKFRENRKYYLTYQTERSGHMATKLVERQLTPDFKSDSPAAARVVWEIEAVTQDHTGGVILFGRDGYLYYGMGDTGPQRDPQGHGQDLNSVLGKILRIDVDRADGALGYEIPKDNPFVHKPGVRPEIWAYGFREPWRASFDPDSGDLWVGDVGQDRVEEVTLVRPGENHGWNVFEGHAAFSDRYRRSGENYVAPVFSYPHSTGVSVTGGYVYRGTQASQLTGRYICGDFESRRIWALTHTNQLLNNIVEIGRAPTRLVSFGQDHAGELFIVGYDSGIIYHLNLATVDLSPRQVQIIAATSEDTPVLYRYTLKSPTNDWFRAEFDDSSWQLSPGGFGTRGTPGAVVRTEWRTRDIWLRRAFSLAKTTNDSKRSLALRLHHDEDSEIYLNGVEVAHVSRWTTGYTELPLADATANALKPGRNVLAIHCRQNSGGQYIDAGLIEYLTPRESTSMKKGSAHE